MQLTASCSGLVILLTVIVNAGMVLTPSHDTPAADASWHEAMVAFIQDMAAECRPRPSRAYRDEDRNEARGEPVPEAPGDALREEQDGVTEPRLSADGVMVAEDMRCRQCRGKCAADNLRCRSQCAGDSTCLDHCQGRTDQCEALCKQIFQCE